MFPPPFFMCNGVFLISKKIQVQWEITIFINEINNADEFKIFIINIGVSYHLTNWWGRFPKDGQIFPEYFQFSF